MLVEHPNLKIISFWGIKLKIVIADDHAVVRTGCCMILNYQNDMEVVATAAMASKLTKK